MKKYRVLFASLLLAAALASCIGCCGTGLSKNKYVIATGSKSGVYYPIGEAIKGIFAKKFPGVEIEILETAGSVENIQLLCDKKADMALIQNDIGYYAVNGEAMYADNKIKCLSGIANLFAEVVQIIIRQDRDIRSLEDLSGKKIAVGSKNSGTYYNAHQLLSLAGVWQKIQPQYLTLTEAMKQLEEGAIDGFFFTTAMPNPSITELASKVDIDIVPINPDLLMKLVNTYSFYYPSTISANSYKGVTQAVEGVEINAIVVSGELLSENDQYLITKNIFSDVDELKATHPRLSQTSKATLMRKMPLPRGNGAQRAYSELL